MRISIRQRIFHPQFFLLVLLALLGFTQAASAVPIVWLEPSLVRVRPFNPPGAATHLNLHAAKGETESFQIIVHAPSGGLNNVTVTPESLEGPLATLYRQHYVYISPGTTDWYTNRNRPEGPGWYPDGLIPFIDPATGEPPVGGMLTAAPFDLPEGKNQPIWVDLYVPRDLPAGDYYCSFLVTSDQGSVNVGVNLRVWSFTLPLRPALKTCFLVYHDFETRTQINQKLIHNRIMPSWVDRHLQRSLIDEYGLNCGDLRFFSNSKVLTGNMDPPPTVQEVQEAISQQQPDLYLYNYTADEIYITGSTMFFDLVKEWARVLHEAGVDSLVVVPPVPALQDYGSGTGRSAVDIWVMLPIQYDVFYYNVQDVLAKGDRCWSYNALVQDDYSPKWQIDFSPINFRIQAGFINQSLNMTGLLYWGVDQWTADTWNHPYGGYGTGYPGEGMFVYPGTEAGLVGVAPSMRLKYLRDGVDDYDYIQLLKERGYGEWALGIAATVGPNWSNWTRDPVALEAARLQLGYKLDELTRMPTVEVSASADPEVVISEQETNLSASAICTAGHAIVTWSWDDGGAGGTFTPSASVKDPVYTAPINDSAQPRTVALTVAATNGGDQPTIGRAFLSLTVMPRYHTVTVTAGVAPSIIPSGGSTNLYATAVDSQGHSGLAWYWSDNEAGGDFSPSNTVRNPIYTAPPNDTDFNNVITLSVTATCKWYSPWVMDTVELLLTVRPPILFSDVSIEHWAFDEIRACVIADIVRGYEDGTYQPNWPVTRDQMAVYIARALAGGDDNVLDPGCDMAPFTDIPCDQWARKYIQFCVSAGVVQGYADGTYLPSLSVDRGQMAVFVARADAGGDSEIPSGPATATFHDVPTDYWAYNHVEYCKAAGIVHGYDAVTYAPEVVVTRDQMAVYIARAFALMM